MIDNEIIENFKLFTVTMDILLAKLKNNQQLRDEDARLVLFRKIIQINDHAEISFDFYVFLLKTHKYWKDRFPDYIISKDNKIKLCQQYEQEIRNYYMSSMYGAFESSIRIISKSVNSEKYSQNYRFSAICKWFFKDFGYENQFQIMKVFSNLRNSTHSNGLFNPLSGRDQTIIFEDKTFVFEFGKYIPYAGWEDLFSITKVISFTINHILFSDTLKNISFIKEPSSDYW